MPYKEVLLSLLKAITLAVSSMGSAIVAFMVHSMPVIQWLGGVLAIVAAVASIRASCATRDAIKKSNHFNSNQ